MLTTEQLKERIKEGNICILCEEYSIYFLKDREIRGLENVCYIFGDVIDGGAKVLFEIDFIKGLSCYRTFYPVDIFCYAEAKGLNLIEK
jgi:hypothetical protein